MTYQPEGAPGQVLPAVEAVREACCRALGLTPGRRQHSAARAPGEERLVKDLLGHGLGPFAAVYGPPDGRPFTAAGARALAASRTRAVLTHRTVLQVLGALHPLLAGADVAYAVLKGPHLAETLYRDLFPRPYGDIDLLVAPDRIAAAVAAAGSLGYRFRGGPLRLRLLRRGHFHIALENERPGLPPLELHWRPVDRANLFRVDSARMLATARELRGAPVAFAVLDPAMTLIYLALHAAKHGLFNGSALLAGRGADWFGMRGSGNRLLWFVDLHLLCESEANRLELPSLAARLREWNVEEEVAKALYIVSLLFPFSPAGPLLVELGLAGFVPRPSRSAVHRFVSGCAGRPAVQRLMEMDETVLLRPMRLLTLGALAFPGAARLARYHRVRRRWLLPAYCLWHPLHMAGRLLSGRDSRA